MVNFSYRSKCDDHIMNYKISIDYANNRESLNRQNEGGVVINLNYKDTEVKQPQINIRAETPKIKMLVTVLNYVMKTKNMNYLKKILRKSS